MSDEHVPTQRLSWRRLRALTVKETRQLLRDKSNLMVGLFLPVVPTVLGRDARPQGGAEPFELDHAVGVDADRVAAGHLGAEDGAAAGGGDDLVDGHLRLDAVETEGAPDLRHRDADPVRPAAGGEQHPADTQHDARLPDEPDGFELVFQGERWGHRAIIAR